MHIKLTVDSEKLTLHIGLVRTRPVGFNHILTTSGSDKRALNFDRTRNSVSFLWRSKSVELLLQILHGTLDTMVQATQISLTDSLALRSLSLRDLEKKLKATTSFCLKVSPCTILTSSNPHCYSSPWGGPHVTSWNPFVLEEVYSLPPQESKIPRPAHSLSFMSVLRKSTTPPNAEVVRLAIFIEPSIIVPEVKCCGCKT